MEFKKHGFSVVILYRAKDIIKKDFAFFKIDGTWGESNFNAKFTSPGEPI